MRHLFLSLSFIVVATACGQGLEEAYEQTEQNAYINPSTRWPDPTSVQVCWTDGYTGSYDDFPVQRAWIRHAVEREFENRREFYVDFEGWGRCVAPLPYQTIYDVGPAIRISIRPGRAHVNGLGRDGAYRWPSMFLDHPLGCTYPTPAEQYRCVTQQAVHEFLHAAGFGHEHERPDAPAPDSELDHNSHGELVVGDYDFDSESNYASGEFHDGMLSDGDVFGLHVMYVSSARPHIEVFDNASYGGMNRIFGVGRFYANEHQLVGNDNISSLKVPEGLWARLCASEGSNGAGYGPCQTFTNDQSTVGYLNDQTSFIEVSPAVTLYSERNYGRTRSYDFLTRRWTWIDVGSKRSFGPGVYHANQLSGIGNDTVTSVRVRDGAIVRLCSDTSAERHSSASR